MPTDRPHPPGPPALLLDGGVDNWYLYARTPDGAIVREGPLTAGWAYALYRDIAGRYPPATAICRRPLHGRVLPPDPRAPTVRARRDRKSWQ